MSAVRIITRPYPDTTQRVQLDGIVYTLRVYWSQRCSCWHMDMSDVDGTPILSGLRLVTGFPLLYRYHHLAVPAGELFFFDERDQAARPTLEDMGERFRLYYVDAGGF
jgi:hypothetical protein